MKKNVQAQLFTLIALLLSGSLTAQVTFSNQAAQLGNITGFSYEDCAVDMNGDNLDDIVRVTGNGIYIDYQLPGGTFTQTFYQMNLINQPSWSICAGDIDGNGYNDLLFGDGSAVSFVYANDDGTGYTEDARPENIFSQRSTMADIDNDGNLDAFVCHDVDQSHPYRNDGTGYLELDQTLIATIDMPGNYAAIWCDYDNDNDIDLYVTKCRGGASPGDPTRTNRLYQNNGNGMYFEVGEQANMADNSQSWATVFEDFDNDGDFDAFIVNHDFYNRFMRNDNDGTFTEIIDNTGINKFDLGAWENASADFDNDGHVDILSEMSTELYYGNGDLTFTAGNAPVTGGGIGDFNSDGFLDIISGNSMWINNGNDNNWVTISTVGILSNRNGIGARVEIHGSWGIQIREIRSGQSFSPMSTLNAHFGLGQATAIDEIVVKWPSGMVTVLQNPDINTQHIIYETDCLLAGSTVTADGPTSLCPGESVTLTAPPGYTYSWNNGEETQSITVNTAGNYSAVLTDSDGCVSISNNINVSIVTEFNPMIEANGDVIFCQGGSVILNATEGSNYNWTDGSSEQSLEVSESGIYSVTVDPVCPGAPLESNTIEVTVLETPQPVVTGATTNPGNTVTLEASGEGLEWYDVETGGSAIATGTSFETPPLNETTTYYVESHVLFPGEIQNGGKEDFTGNGGLPSSGGSSFFNTWETFTILSVEVMVPANAPAGNRTVQLVDENEQVLAEQTFDLAVGTHVLELNFDVPVGNGLSLRCLEHNLFRNSGGVTYPYPIGEVGEITTSTFGDSYYYYFYNWKIQKEDITCVSDRVEVTVTVTGTEEIEAYGSLSLYPNPASDNVQVVFDAKAALSANIRLLDVLGRELMLQEIDRLVIGSNVIELSVKDLPAGMYQVQFQIDGQTATRKLIVE
ncbi:MAG: VCBS repeat-containing protein [Saprospiraceae bacterium]|nr:VCBS repeat-containing protein [Saprospiraceae bacterium]